MSRARNIERIRAMLSAGLRLNKEQRDILERDWHNDSVACEKAEHERELADKKKYDEEHPVIGYTTSNHGMGLRGGMFQDSYGENDILVPIRK